MSGLRYVVTAGVALLLSLSLLAQQSPEAEKTGRGECASRPGLAACAAQALAVPSTSPGSADRFDSLAAGDWKLAFDDDCTGMWQDKWVLDGEMAHIEHSDKGMTLFTGEWSAKDKAHAVLWTKKSFEGDLKIEYDFTRIDTDTLHNLVNIIYIEATGSGEGDYARDIMQWSDLRRVPAMKLYFDNMNTYHISYAVRGDPDTDEYIRARRYMPDKKTGLKGTEMHPEYGREGLFQPGVTYRLTFIKSGKTLYMNVRDSENLNRTFFFDASDFPPITEGYIGLRQMGGRTSTYKNFRVYLMQHKPFGSAGP